MHLAPLWFRHLSTVISESLGRCSVVSSTPQSVTPGLHDVFWDSRSKAMSRLPTISYSINDVAEREHRAIAFWSTFHISGSVPDGSQTLSFSFVTLLWNKYYPHFSNEVTDLQRSYIICMRLHPCNKRGNQHSDFYLFYSKAYFLPLFPHNSNLKLNFIVLPFHSNWNLWEWCFILYFIINWLFPLPVGGCFSSLQLTCTLGPECSVEQNLVKVNFSQPSGILWLPKKKCL